MKVYKIIFSPTGGTDKVASVLTGALGSEIVTVDLSEQSFAGCTLDKDSIAVIAMPSFGGRAPKIAVDRLKMVQGSGAKTVAVAVYGNRAQEDTLIEIADAAKSSGFEVIAGIAAVAEHSIAHQYASGRPDPKDNGQLREFAEKIKEKIGSGANTLPSIPGNRPYKKAGAGLVPKGTRTCADCKLCVEKCPAAAIGRNDPKVTDSERCINCMRCVVICPQKARVVSGVMVKVVGVALKKACGERKDNELYI